MPNVVLESIACGTPVIASDVGGIGEIVTDARLGALLSERSGIAVAEGWDSLRQRGIDRRKIRKLATRFSWDETAARLAEIMESCLSRRRGSRAKES
jgi:glycosyltransferase involved in cell wall biosynthesis